ncbi:MAG: hypothetical protein Tp167SUR398091_6 [Prokaryotic dsDNA virus sp.]|nr:MAG: hypothetical protein Tp167SUR398091_6 [Prokaryotic dsDNA virus sp.]|tara:strand:+ start:4295 stop:5104 length:810 start_codon:yes stop_codon:yes gene_type:complete
MANTIDQAFIKQFETEVHMAYQRMGSKLRNTIRSTNVSGSTARFQKIGTGSATTKSRNGNVTPMELAHTNVEVTMSDFYAAEYIDKLDELKTNINERQAVAQSAAAALGRKTDELIIAAMDAGANSTQIHDTGSALAKVDLLSLFETMGTADVPEDGQRYLAMSPAGYADLFAITEFASSDFVGPQNLPFAGGMTMKEFLGFKIFSTSAVAGGKNFAYHTTAVGIGVNSDVQTEVNYVAEKVSHLATSMMSMGSVAIDDNGIYEVLDNN